MTMTTAEYLTALRKLGLQPQSRQTASTLGRSLRMIAYYASGEKPVPAVIANLLNALARSSDKQR